MPSNKTEGTELSIAFGILGMDPESPSSTIEQCFEATLEPLKYQSYLEEYRKRKDYYQRFLSIGNQVRTLYPRFASASLKSLRWEGRRKQARSVLVPKDLEVGNTPISVKADSDIVFNFSLHSLFVGLPNGQPGRNRSPNWYRAIAPYRYQELYAFALSTANEIGLCHDLPTSVDAYHKQVKGHDNQRRLSQAIKMFDEDQKVVFQNLLILPEKSRGEDKPLS